MKMETIYALASGRGRAGVAVLRLSGPAAGVALTALSGKPLPTARTAVRRRFHHPQTGEVVDDGLALWFPAPHSYTGEDVAELHIHGGLATIRAVCTALEACPDMRLAEPGEFTRRAFHNDRMDLTEAEGLADLIDAETEAQRRQALRQADGALGRLYDGWAGRLTRLLAHAEAAIDFAEEDLSGSVADQAREQAEALLAEITAHLDDNHRGERLRQGVRIALIGPPNAGKSSLLNCLARREAAIVSDTAGTTRDVLEVHLDLHGWPVILADTAGLRETADAVEREGVRRALSTADQADLRVLVLDAARPEEADAVLARRGNSADFILLNKTDLSDEAARRSWREQVAARHEQAVCLDISVKAERGIREFLGQLTQRAEREFERTEAPVITRQRHRAALQDCVEALRRSQTAPEAALAAEDLRLALRALGHITGRVSVEDLLDVVFRDFCIGK